MNIFISGVRTGSSALAKELIVSRTITMINELFIFVFVDVKINDLYHGLQIAAYIRLVVFKLSITVRVSVLTQD